MDIFSYQLKGLVVLGLGREPTTWIFKIILHVYRYLLWIFLMYFLCMFAIFIAENYGNVMEAVMVVASLAVDIISVSKVFAFWCNLDRIYALMDNIQKSERNKRGDHCNERFIIIIISDAEKCKSQHCLKANTFGQMFTKVFAYQLLMATVVYNAVPILQNLFRHFIYGSEWTPDMPFKLKSFFDLHYSPAYEITYMALFIDISFIALICVSRIGVSFVVS
jgi:hypothetical protein